MWESVCESGVKERVSVIVCVKERESVSESDVKERVNAALNEGRGQSNVHSRESGVCVCERERERERESERV